jgi:hypothetical protein
MKETIPRQIMQLTRRIDAVCVYLGEDGIPVIDRIPVIALALCDEVEISKYEGEEEQMVEKGIIKYVLFSGDNYFDLDEPQNLLGYEIDGDQQTWGREIKNYLISEQNKKESWEEHQKRLLSIKAKCGDQAAKDFNKRWGIGSCPTNRKSTEEFEKLMGQQHEPNLQR